jgi:hypothetical protein
MTTARKTQPEPGQPEAVTIKFAKDKDTPGTIRYAEIVPDDDVARVKTIYLQKFFAKDLGFPQTITVTLRPAASGRDGARAGANGICPRPRPPGSPGTVTAGLRWSTAPGRVGGAFPGAAARALPTRPCTPRGGWRGPRRSRRRR